MSTKRRFYIRLLIVLCRSLMDKCSYKLHLDVVKIKAAL